MSSHSDRSRAADTAEETFGGAVLIGVLVVMAGLWLLDSSLSFRALLSLALIVAALVWVVRRRRWGRW